MSEKNPSYDELVAQLNDLKAENNRLRNEAQKCDRDINRLKSLISNLQMGVLIEGEDRKIIDVNHYFCQLFGIPSPDAIKGMDCEESAKIAAQSFVDPDGFVDQINSTVKRRKVALNQQLQRKDGGIYERDYVPVYQGDHFIGDMWIYRDASKRKKAEAKLKESEERFRKLIENMDEAVVLHNPEGAIIESNRKAEQILTLNAKNIKGQTSKEFIYKTIHEDGTDYPGENHPAMLTLQEGIAVHDVIMGIIKDDGHLTWIKINSEPIYLHDSKKPYAIVTFSDITKLKDKEQKLTELNATKDKLFSIISHDLKNPCQAMLSLSGMIVKNIKENDFTYLEKQSELLHQSAKQSVSLINNLLQWSRAQTGRLEYNEEHISIKELAENILALSKVSLYEKGLITKTDIPEDLKIKGDRFMIELIIRNLVSNSIKYTYEGGKIELKAYQTKAKTTISVSDTGIGIKKEDLDKLFDIGTNFKRPGTSDEKGTGLGLILCKEFTEIHGGVIQVKSKEDKGSTFSVILPAKA